MVNCCGPCGLGGGGDSGFTAVNRTFIFAPEVAHKAEFNALMDKVGSVCRHMSQSLIAWLGLKASRYFVLSLSGRYITIMNNNNNKANLLRRTVNFLITTTKQRGDNIIIIIINN